MRKLLSLSILIVLFLGWACTEEESETTVLVTEEVLYTSAENVRLLGRLITNQTITVADHGFYLSEDEAFASPIIISLGPKDGPGRFIGEANGLTNSKSYFAKTFMDLGGEIQFGNVIQLNTLGPVLESFSPTFGAVGQTLDIIGQNFTADTKVFFGENEAVINSLDFESRIKVTIPSASNVSVPIRVVVQDKTLEFPTSFEYQIGTYELISKFPESVRIYDNVFYNASNGLIIGLGTVSKNSFYSKFQQFDLGSKSWKEVSFPGSSRSFAFFTNNYIGGGTAALTPNPYTINQSFWRINGGGFERLPDLPFESRESIAFESNGSLYVLGSKEGNPLALRKYNPSTKAWQNLPESPVEFSATNANFVYEGNFYVVDSEAILWKYDVSSGQWNSVSTYPGNLGQGYGMGQVIGDKAYVGLYRRTTDLWELNLNTMTWISKNDIPRTAQDITVAHFEKDGFLYIMRMPDITIAGSFPMNLYKFDPNGL
ncbi:IPT/TIG domain-containing protein [Algoriphagus pacificus]|uniref:IPT/TIG domain-containing protein n=1 Tax=Algoriphagus pacificus TaxID=2811234 RepID=A0ABS3CCS2_9BACT|nr:IPT/TIG domain-containing protein [Algoriphagus pacificus]MBN7814000.1 IPT/TIG domain-containing protein [Algoriphagus pacificus]